MKIMKTIIEKIDKNQKNTDIIREAGRILKEGGLVAFPTETVYGLGADALHPEASKKIYAAKGRPSDNPLIVHIADMDAVYKLASEVPEAAVKLADKFWPGPLTMILKKSDIVPESITGGLGTVATRADIIDKLFSSYLIEKKENEIFITSKAKQLLSLVPEDLKKPELTAEWESRLSAIAKGKASDRKFMREIATYTKELMKQIQNGTGTFRHDNLTNKICPECGKRLLLVNGKQGKLYVCQDRECGYKERISRLTNARCPVCHKKMELVGAKDKQKFVCSCGHKESMQAFENRRKKEGAGVSKKDVANYMKKMKKEEKQPLNNALADALANLKL